MPQATRFQILDEPLASFEAPVRPSDANARGGDARVIERDRGDHDRVVQHVGVVDLACRAASDDAGPPVNAPQQVDAPT